jgi:hypothetical protein
MKRSGVVLAAALLAGCSSVSSRIHERQAEFDSYPPSVQDEIRDGRIDIGFTPDQVFMALGRPDRVLERKDVGNSRETWLYGVGGGPLVGIGFGMGGPGFGTGVAMSPAPEGGARLRVVFDDGHVVSIDSRRD